MLLARGELCLAVVLGIVSKFYGGEYDPLYVERVKQTLFMLFEEKLLAILDQDFNNVCLSTPFHSAKLGSKAPPMHVRVPKKGTSRKTGRGIPTGKRRDDEREFESEQPRVSLIRSSELLSHERKNRPYESFREVKPAGNYESSSYVEPVSSFDEEAKISMNLTMKAPLDASTSIKKMRNSSFGPNSRNKDPGLVRSNSATRQKPENYQASVIGDLMKIDPISIPLSKGKLYHYLHVADKSGLNLNPPIKASPNWFGQVYKSIFRSYSYLYPLINTQEMFSGNNK